MMHDEREEKLRRRATKRGNGLSLQRGGNSEFKAAEFSLHRGENSVMPVGKGNRVLKGDPEYAEWVASLSERYQRS